MDIQIEQWVCITYYKLVPGFRHNIDKPEVIFQYNLPRHMWIRYGWVIRWRGAKLQCQFPKCNISTSLSFYDVKTGADVGFQSAYQKVSSAKAQLTKWKNKMAKAKEHYVPTIFHPTIETTPEWIKAAKTVQAKEYELLLAEAAFKQEVESKNPTANA